MDVRQPVEYELGHLPGARLIPLGDPGRGGLGGINSWEGLTAGCPLEAAMAWFSEAASTEELLALAWLLEDGSLRLYKGVEEEEKDAEALGWAKGRGLLDVLELMMSLEANS